MTVSPRARQETYGEDPLLTAHLAYQYVRGMQGDHPKYVQVISSPKHFDAYGGATTRGHRSPTEVSVSWRDWQVSSSNTIPRLPPLCTSQREKHGAV